MSTSILGNTLRVVADSGASWAVPYRALSALSRVVEKVSQSHLPALTGAGAVALSATAVYLATRGTHEEAETAVTSAATDAEVESKGADPQEELDQLYRSAIEEANKRARLAASTAKVAGQMLADVRKMHTRVVELQKVVVKASGCAPELVKELEQPLNDANTELAHKLEDSNILLELVGVKMAFKGGIYTFEMLEKPAVQEIANEVIKLEKIEGPGLGVKEKESLVCSFACADNHQQRLERYLADEKKELAAINDCLQNEANPDEIEQLRKEWQASDDKIALLSIRIADYKEKKADFMRQMKIDQEETRSFAPLFDRMS